MNTSLALESLAPLLEYPQGNYHALAEACLAAAGDGGDAEDQAIQNVRGYLVTFVGFVRQSERSELEELFTRTFDLNPTCSLDVGWHLYGEQYARGSFLVSLRAALRAHNIHEETELPDHLPSLLRLLARLETDEAADLAEKSLRPAVAKMMTAFPDEQNPFSSLLRAVAGLLDCMCLEETGEARHD